MFVPACAPTGQSLKFGNITQNSCGLLIEFILGSLWVLKTKLALVEQNKRGVSNLIQRAKALRMENEGGGRILDGPETPELALEQTKRSYPLSLLVTEPFSG